MDGSRIHPRRRQLPAGRSLRLRAVAGAAGVTAALAIAGCGGSAASSGSSGGSGSSSGSPSLPALTGKRIFESQGCAGCHTLAAAGATGNVGPDLDNLKPSYAAVVKQVTNGGGGMPSFRGQLTRAEIGKVAEFVSSATH